MIDLIRSEPVRVAAFLHALVALVAVFVLHLSDVQIAALVAVLDTALAIIVRGQVAPVSRLRGR